MVTMQKRKEKRRRRANHALFLLPFDMRKPTAETRFVTIPGSYVKFFYSFELLVDQLISSGITLLFWQTSPKYRLWVNDPNRQVIFIDQNIQRDVRRCDGQLISIDQIENFLKTGG